jgi:hypothetical protein
MHDPHPRAQLYGQIRTGRVSAVGKTRHTVEVEFFEGDGFVSWDLHVLVTRPGDYSLPPKDTPVLCLLIEGRLGVGYVLGAIYTDADAAPLDDDGKRSIAGDDIRIGDPDAEDKVALAPAVKDEIQKVLDFAKGINDALNNAAPFTPQDGGAGIFGAVRALLLTNVAPTLEEPAAESVSAK